MPMLILNRKKKYTASRGKSQAVIDKNFDDALRQAEEHHRQNELRKLQASANPKTEKPDERKAKENTEKAFWEQFPIFHARKEKAVDALVLIHIASRGKPLGRAFET